MDENVIVAGIFVSMSFCLTSRMLLDENNALRVWNSTISNQNKANTQAGEIIAIDKQGVHVACGENTFICLTSVQWPGGKALNAQQIAQTQKLHVGQILP